VSILFPVYFRHPDAPALPGDTILKKSGAAAVLNRPAEAKDAVRSAAGASANVKAKTTPVTTSRKKTTTKASSKKQP
jgi:hypothetical protein